MRRIVTIIAVVTLLLFSLQCVAFAQNEMPQPKKSKNILIKMKDDSPGLETKERGKKAKKQKRLHKNKKIYLLEADEELINSLKEDENVEFVEEDAAVTTLEDKITWNIEKISAPVLHTENYYGEGIKVAVFDTGIDSNNSELNVKGGASFIEGINSFSDDNGHGTAIAGILSALNNGKGLIGAAPEIDLYSVKVLDTAGNGVYSNIIQGIQWAIENNMDIIVMSFGGPSYSKILKDAIHEAQENNILVVAASGNGGSTDICYPARYSDVVCVGAVDQNNNIASFTNTGIEMDLVAPGVDIETTGLNNTTATMSGTSAAVPHVAGVAAQLWEIKRELTVDQMKALLYKSAIPLGELETYGWGLVNAEVAYYKKDLNLDMPQNYYPPTEPTENIGEDGEVNTQAVIVYGDGQTVEAGNPALIIIRFSDDHPSCTVTIKNQSGYTVYRNNIGAVYANTNKIFRWYTTSSTPGGRYTVKFDVNNPYVTYCNVNVINNTSPPPPPDDHGDTFSTATYMSVPGSRPGRIEVSGDVDFFRFVPSTSGNYTIQTTGSTDTYGHLYNSSRSQITSNDDDGEGPNFLITRYLSANQTYYVKVRHFSIGTGSYYLNVSFTPPSLQITSGPSVSNISGNGAVINWTTNISSSSIVEYGTTTSLGQTATGSTSTSHSVTLSGLNPGTKYYYRVKSIANGVPVTSGISEFTTPITLTFTNGPSVSNITSNSAQINWSTNVSASSIVEYGTSSNLAGFQTATGDTTAVHSVLLSGLNPGTTYYYRVKSGTLTSAIKNFTTQSTIPINIVAQKDDTKTDPKSQESEPIDTATGSQFMDRNLLTVNGAIPIPFNISYNSLLLDEGSLGKAWGHNYEARVEEQDDGSIRIHWTANKRNTFTSSGVNQYTSDNSATRYDKLVKNSDGSFTLTRKDKSIYKFNNTGRLLEIGNGHGHYLTLSYDASGRLASVNEPVSGKFLTFTYNTSNLIQKVTDNANREVSFTYDANNCIIGITDSLNKTITYSCDASGRIVSSTDADNVRIFTNTFDEKGRVISQDDGVSGNQITQFNYDETTEPGKVITTVTNRNGNTRILTHDSNLRLLQEVNQLGHTTTYTYDANGNRITETDAKGNTIRYTYDDRGNLLTATDPAGNVTTMTYDERNNLLSIQNAAGKSNTYTYDSNNNLLSVTDPLSNTITYTYQNGLLQSRIQSNGGTTNYTYENGLVKTVTSPAGYISTFNYDAVGRLTSVTDGAGNTSNMAYDAIGNLTTITNPLGNSVSYTYDARGNKTSETDAKGNTIRYFYNGNGKLSKITNALGQDTVYEYDGEDHLVRIIDARNNSTAFTLDAKGRTTGLTNALGKTMTTEYDQLDNITAQKDAYNRQILGITYDTLNNPITITDALGNTTTNRYDNLNRLIETIDALGRKTSFNYDDLNRLTSTVNALNGQSRQSFDSDGNVVLLRDTNGNQLSYAYDNMGRVISQTSSSGKNISYEYEQTRDLLKKTTNARGQITTYQYDAAGRIISFTDPVGTVSYTYDANGNVLTVNDNKGTISYKYDVLNRLIRYTDVYNNSIGYEYDAVGNLTTLTYPDGKQVYYAYDAINQLISVTDWANRTTSYSYDNNGRLTETTRADGTVETRTYDAAGRLTQIKDVKAGTIINQFDYTYDAVSNITQENGGMLAEAKLVLPPSGNMTYGGDNRLATYKGEQVVYDADGNMTSGPLKGKMVNYQYDARNRLTAVGDTSYTYDANNTRIAIDENGETTRYVVNPNAGLSQILMETDTQGSIKAYYIYGIGLISREDTTTNTANNYHFDRRGSTVALTDNSGNVTDRYNYGPYGEIIQKEGTTDNIFSYVGQYGIVTDTNGLYYMRARYYNPEIKSFINEDVVIGNIDDSLSLNRYGYVKGNPIRYIDPEGRYTIFVGKTGSIGAGIGLTGNIGVAMDDEWHFANINTVGGGGMTPVLGLNYTVTITNAENLNSLKGLGFESGGSAFYAGVEYTWSDQFKGVTVNIGPSGVYGLIPAEIHANILWTFKWDVLSAQKQDEIKNIILDKINWLNDNLPNETRKKINEYIGDNVFDTYGTQQDGNK